MNVDMKSTKKFKHHWLIYITLLFTLVGISFLGSLLAQHSKYTSPTAATMDFRPQVPPQDIINKLKQVNPAEAIRVPILIYHYIEYVKDKNDTIRISLTTPPSTLDLQIKTLIENGFTLMTQSELADVIDGKKDLPEKPILLTFDDGYRDFYTDAYPILKKYHAKAIEFVVSGFLNWPNYMFESQVRRIAQDNLVEIGAHTMHHVPLRGLKLDRLESEVFGSKLTLEKLTGKPIVSFAFPYGSFDAVAVATVQKAGFTSAVTTLPGIIQGKHNKFFLYRLRPGGRIGQTLLDWLNEPENKLSR